MAVAALVPLVLGVLFLLLAMGAHLGLAMVAVAIFGTAMIVGLDAALFLAGQSVMETAQSFDLSVIPLFILMGTFASKSGIAADLFSAFNFWLRRRKGGLAQASIAACAAFGSVCGSSLATAATLGKVALPQMQKFGYSAQLASGSIAAGGTIGILIPPSVVMMIYGILTETSIGDLFLAGIVPGLLLTVLFMVTVMVIVRFNPLAAPDVEGAFDTAGGGTFKKVWATLGLFVLVIGGIYSGVFTPTEASGIGAVGALAIGVVTGRLNALLIWESMIETVTTTSMIFLVLIGAILFTSFLSLSGTPALLAGWVDGLALSPVQAIVLIVLIHIVLGAFLDAMSMVMLSVPVFFPIVSNLGFDPVWFGILVVMVVELALITPPMGINVFVIRSIAPDISLAQVFAGVLPFCVPLLVLIAVVIAVPSIVTFLPDIAR